MLFGSVKEEEFGSWLLFNQIWINLTINRESKSLIPGFYWDIKKLFILNKNKRIFHPKNNNINFPEFCSPSVIMNQHEEGVIRDNMKSTKRVDHKLLTFFIWTHKVMLLSFLFCCLIQKICVPLSRHCRWDELEFSSFWMTSNGTKNYFNKNKKFFNWKNWDSFSLIKFI